MTHDGILDRGWVQPQLLHSSDNFIFDRVIKDGVEYDNAFGGRDGPDRVLGLPEKVEVIKDPHWFGMPTRSIGRSCRPLAAPAPHPRRAATARCCCRCRACASRSRPI